MTEINSYEKQMEHFNAVMNRAVTAAPCPLRLNDMEIRVLSWHRSLHGAQEKIPEHEHPTYELTFMNVDNMITSIDQHHIECQDNDDRILLIPPLTLHHRVFGPEEINVNQSMTFTLSGTTDEGNLRCMALPKLVESKGFLLTRTTEQESLLWEMERQVELETELSSVAILHLLYAFITIFFQQNFAELFQKITKEHLINQFFFGFDRVGAIKKALAHVLNQKVTQQYFEQQFGMSRRHLNRIFKNETGQTITQYQKKQKMMRAKELLSGTSISIAEIAHVLGFKSQARFATFFQQHQACSPSQFRNDHKAHSSWM